MSLATRIGQMIYDLLTPGVSLPVVAAVGLPVLVMESAVDTAVTPGGATPGWISGDPSALAASGNVLVKFDLGPDWDQYRVVSLNFNPIGPSSGFTAVQASGGRASAVDANFRLKDALAVGPVAAMSAAMTTAAGPQQAYVRPAGRYVTVSITNADATNAVGANSHVTLCAYPS